MPSLYVAPFFNSPLKTHFSTVGVLLFELIIFIHEFGHYLRFLIAQIAYHRNKKAVEDFRNVTDLVRSRADVAKNKHDNYFTRGEFTVDEEENFAKSWEQYLKDGIAPDKKHKKLFEDFRKFIFDDMHRRSEKRKYEFYEDEEETE